MFPIPCCISPRLPQNPPPRTAAPSSLLFLAGTKVRITSSFTNLQFHHFGTTHLSLNMHVDTSIVICFWNIFLCQYHHKIFQEKKEKHNEKKNSSRHLENNRVCYLSLFFFFSLLFKSSFKWLSRYIPFRKEDEKVPFTGILNVCYAYKQSCSDKEWL